MLDKGLSPDGPPSALNVKARLCVHVCFDGGKIENSLRYLVLQRYAGRRSTKTGEK